MPEHYRIQKAFEFSASHQLEGLPEDHQCARLHGHNYVIKVQLFNYELDEVGFVRDYGDMNVFKRYLDEKFDHRHLNDVMGETNPTAENMARWFFTWLVTYSGFGRLIYAVCVCETPKTEAWYYG